MWQAVGDTVSRPKGGTVAYRNGPQFKPALWGKKQGDLFAKSKSKHGIGSYSKDPMRFVHIERQVRGQRKCGEALWLRGLTRAKVLLLLCACVCVSVGGFGLVCMVHK